MLGVSLAHHNIFTDEVRVFTNEMPDLAMPVPHALRGDAAPSPIAVTEQRWNLAIRRL